MGQPEQKDGQPNREHAPAVVPADEVMHNANPRANENIRVRTDPPEKKNSADTKGVGSEITDGEDG